MVDCPYKFKHYRAPDGVNVSEYFQKVDAVNWSASHYYDYHCSYATRKLKNRLLNQFKNNLFKLKTAEGIPNAIKKYITALTYTSYNDDDEQESGSRIAYYDSSINIAGNNNIFNAAGSSTTIKRLKTTPSASSATTSTAAFTGTTASTTTGTTSSATTGTTSSATTSSAAISEQSNATSDDDADILANDTSFTSSNETDDSFKETDDQTNAREENLHKKRYCYISAHEIIKPLTTLELYYFPDEIAFEERVLLSHINIVEPSKSLPTAAFSLAFKEVIESYRKSIAYKMDMPCANYGEMNRVEKSMACALYLQSTQIQKSKQLLSCALPLMFTDPKYNREFDFTMKHIFLLINTLFLSSTLHLDWDITSNIYQDNPEKSMQCCRHDMIFTNNEGLEIGTGEVKPPNTAYELIDIDRSRIAESLKKQLHRRLLTARSPKELCTFGILVYGNKLELRKLNLTASGSYDYQKIYDANLATTTDDYGFINETIEILYSFVQLAEDSLPTNEDRSHPLLLPDYSSFIKPTVYMSNIGDPEKSKP